VELQDKVKHHRGCRRHWQAIADTYAREGGKVGRAVVGHGWFMQ
jgi:hypothetical protein